MRKLKLRYVRGKNFKCFGPEGIEIFFDDHSNVVLIKGINLDNASNDPREHEGTSNGAGKSSILDLISWVFYGKTVTKPKKIDHNDVINSLHVDECMEGEVQVDEYRIVRSRNTDKIEIWKSKDHIWDRHSKITKGAGVQKFIENTIVGLSHTAFCNVVVFDDSNSYCFLELDAKGKREVVENLLGLERYRDHLDTAKAKLKEINLQIKDISKDYDRTLSEVSAAKTRIEEVKKKEVVWQESKAKELDSLRFRLKGKQLELETCGDIGESVRLFEQAQERLRDLTDKIPELEAKKEKVAAVLKEASAKLTLAQESRSEIRQIISGHTLGISQADHDLKKAKLGIASLERLEEGQQCPVCHGAVNKDNYKNILLHEHNKIHGMVADIEVIVAKKKADEERLVKKDEILAKLEAYMEDAENKVRTITSTLDQWRKEVVSLSKVQRPEAGIQEKMLEEQIFELRRQLRDKEIECKESPYKEIIESAIEEQEKKQVELEGKVKELKVVEDEVPYYEYWVKAFGDNGIRRYAVNNIIPTLNAKIAYWLQYLTDSKIELKFDDKLDETITRNGVPAYYHTMSNGEKRRINLAVSQAFAYVMMINSGSCPSLVFLDEITGGGIDRAGIAGIYNMIFELAKERQVFVTTHNQHLLDMLQGCEEIVLVKKGDITKIAA